MKRSIEKLSHFQCGACNKWWSVGDAPQDKKEWYCCWCGHHCKEVEDIPEGKFPDVEQFKKMADELQSELGKLASMFGFDPNNPKAFNWDWFKKK